MDEIRSRFGVPISLFAGALLPLSFAPFNFWILAPACIAALFWVLPGAAPRRAFILALSFGLCSFLGGTYWTFISVTVYYGAPVALGLAATAGLVLALALFFACAIAAAARLDGLSGRLGQVVVMPSVWIIAEWCRGWLFSGFGWLSLGYSQTDTWLMSLAPVFGVLGVSAAVALTAAAIVLIARRRDGFARAAGFATIAAVWLVSWLLDAHRWTQPAPSAVNIAIAQAAIPQDQKWLPEQYLPTLRTYRDLSLSAPGRDIVVWPEVAVPNLFSSARGFLEDVQTELAGSGATLVTGILRNHDDGNARNAVVAMTPEPQFYVKRHLVPFGEYMPLPDFFLRWLDAWNVPYPNIGAGSPEQPLLRVAGESIAVSICYEDVFGAEQLDFLPEATLIVNVANDAWFGRSIAADQHLQIARVRAAEAGRYVIRATNTGVSAIMDPLGNVVRSGPKFEPVLLSATVQGFTGRTPYVAWGNYPVVIAAFAALTAAAVLRARRRD